MNRNKRTRNSRKGSPLSIDLRDFLMYSNPSRFAPKVKQTGGQAYPQAPTMDQFYSYGAPTPHTPFVFQDGGNMMSFEDPKPNKVNSFLERIKQKGYEALQKEMEDESMMMGDAYDQASMEMDTAMMQWGGGWSGGYETNFDKANQWGDLANQDTDMMGVFSDFAGAAQDFAGNPDEYYIKKMKYNYKPTAQYGMELQEFQGDFGQSQVNRDAALAQAAYLRGLPATASGPIANPFQMFSVPGAAQATVTSRGQKRPVRTIDRNATIGMPDYYVGENSYAGYVPQGVQETPIAARNNQPINFGILDGNWSPFGSGRTYQQRGDGSILLNPNQQTKEEQKPAAPKATSKKTQTATKPAAPAGPANQKPVAEDTPPEGTTIGRDANGNDISIKPGTQPTAPETGAGAPENKTPQQVQQEAAQLGMSPQQYMTFLTHADVKMGPLGRRLRKASFDFTTYGPGMNPVTASVPGGNNQQNPSGANVQQNSEDVPGGKNNQAGAKEKDGFFKRVFGRPDEQERWNPDNRARMFSSRVKNVETPVGESTFETEGYADKNYMSDFRNERATNRLNQLGQRIDRNMQRENALDQRYDAPISDRMERLRNRDERRYNRIANRFDRDEYTGPAFQYGGYFQDGGEDPFGTSGYSMDGSDTTEREDYAGNTIYETPPAMGPTEVGKGKLDVKFGKKQNPYTKQFIGAGLDLLSAGLQNREASRNEKMFRNKMGADQVFTPMTDMSRGDYTANEGYFRPDQQVPTQFTGYNFESPYARMGGSYKKGGEYYLTQDEIDEIIAMGGQIEFLD